MAHIVPDNKKEDICNLFDLKVDKDACWNGEVSAHFKGAARKKINVASKTKLRRSKSVGWSEYMVKNKHLILPLVVVALIGGFYMWREWRVRNAMWKRQIRNL